MDTISPITVARFWSKVSVRDNNNDCWEWTSGLSEKGYGRFRLSAEGRRIVRAHRFAYVLAKGEIPEERVIMHVCNNPKCCNPYHLVCSTVAANNLHTRMCGAHRNGANKRKLPADRSPTITYEQSKAAVDAILRDHG